MTDAVAVALIAGVPLMLAAVGNLYVIVRQARVEKKVDKIETQTNSMNSQMVDSALIKGEKTGKEKAEAVAATAAAVAAVIPTPPLPIPLVIASGTTKQEQDNIVELVAQGIAKGILMEKKRRADEGNGPTKP